MDQQPGQDNLGLLIVARNEGLRFHSRICSSLDVPLAGSPSLPHRPSRPGRPGRPGRDSNGPQTGNAR